MINWGILSTANIAQKAVIPAIKNAKNANVYGMGSSNNKVQEVAKNLEIPNVYTSYDELLDDPNIHAVYVPLPNTLHKEWVIKAASKGKHVLCEKPAALTSQDVQEMVDACEKHNVLFMEAFMYQFQPQHARVKEIIASGVIGEVKHFQSTFTFKLNLEDSNNIRLNAELGGGSVWDVGCYCIHAARLILGQEPKEVYVKGNVHPTYQVDISATGILTFEDGVSASIYSGFEQPMNDTYEVEGTKGRISVPMAYRPDRRDDGLGEIIVTTENGESRSETFSGNQYVLMIEHFSNSILENKQPSYTGQQTINNIKTIEACYESIKAGALVKL
ncbi:putative dehydrogenase [Bacillus mesophilus]|uniref:Gfo/Idh/MocA family oxidoreductase n=1 Tax=Bacillus mesophilus TaxID=1808955 RepID=A0A6M0Q9F4_9BACI|nr:Gfo/Idh/MocA family oxidoreductase [Bacillus mesophilus]MBM7662355.1 putative dehydrogenase [Bacillus mesophilus]NEY73016.1 Gfo/Idh/MocA family oxidoreductase [Bacillus mesophilus]